MTDATNKCPYVVQKGTMDGQPAGICRFYKVHKKMCPLLTMPSENDDDVTCFDLPVNLLQIIKRSLPPDG